MMKTDEQMDYVLHRLKLEKSICMIPGNWAYLASNGSLHKLVNEGYYSPWRTNMWVSSYHFFNPQRGCTWGLGEIASSKKQLIQAIEAKVSDYPPWEDGYGKTSKIELEV